MTIAGGVGRGIGGIMKGEVDKGRGRELDNERSEYLTGRGVS